MPNFVDVKYHATGKSLDVDSLGMREMQRRAFEARQSKYILLKAPPASGKSRALMYLGLDKIYNQGIKKVIVAVPERTIGKSFAKTKLKKNGFFADWDYDDKYNLCTPGSEKKVELFKVFLEDKSATILICTHATLRFAYNQLKEEAFNNTLLAIDEFHHVSSALENRLGEVLHAVMKKTNAHIIAMTGSYFRGDSVLVLLPEDEILFTKVTYNYYEQLNGYKYLKTLGIGYHFYQGKYLDAIAKVLDTDKKTIVHIPSPNASESTKDKIKEVDTIIDVIGEFQKQDEDTGLIFVKRKEDGKILKVADLVNDTPKDRDKVMNFLRIMEKIDDVDIIIALGMAIEGFDWPFCEHALTIGYRGSLTQIIQIIGRATRDSENKTHSQFTNLIAQPDAGTDDVKVSVNNMLKAISASLLMEQVLAPHVNFKSRNNEDQKFPKGTIGIKGFKEPSAKVRQIVDADLNDLKASILQDTEMLKAMTGKIVEPEIMNKIMLQKILHTKYPDLGEEEIEELRQYVVADSLIKNSEIKTTGNNQFIRMAGQFINIDNLNIDLIDSINPFQKAYEVLSRTVTTSLLKLIGDTIELQRIAMTDGEAYELYMNSIPKFIKENNREPDIHSINEREKRMAEAIIYLKNKKRQKQQKDNA